ncbi:MAG: hypothetical protein JWP25_9099 [Bradyrhizobium sp.]|jgi:hypothetical protein|nr:hypothetical protein [Bradyrhizobium sp.]
MIRTLSAPGTFAQRYVFLVLWFCILGGINILMWWGKLFDPHGGPPSPEAKIVFLVIWLVPPLVAAWLTRSLKRVRMSDEGLLISDYRREILVPFSAIESISPIRRSSRFSPSRSGSERRLSSATESSSFHALAMAFCPGPTRP